MFFRFFITATTFEFFCDCPHNPSNGFLLGFSSLILYSSLIANLHSLVLSFTCPQAHRRHIRMPRHIPSLIIVLKGYSPPCASIEPIWEQHIHTMATMNIPAIPGQAITLRLVADLQYFSRHSSHSVPGRTKRRCCHFQRYKQVGSYHQYVYSCL